MKEHFILQRTLFERFLEDEKVKPLWVYLVMPIVFFLLSELLFRKLSYANIGYPLIIMVFLNTIRRAERSEFFNKIYSKNKYREIRLLEHLLWVLPGIVFLLYKLAFISAICLFLGSILLSFIPDFKFNNRVLPTPFGKIPFEFPIGFRSVFLIYPIAVFVFFMALQVGNFNLALVVTALLLLVAMNYYAKPEPQIYIRAYTCTQQTFILRKIKQACYGGLILVLPFGAILGIYYPAKIGVIFLIIVLGLLYLCAAVLGKYATYPSHLNILQGFALGLSLLMPPLLLFIIPWFFKKAIKNERILLPN